MYPRRKEERGECRIKMIMYPSRKKGRKGEDRRKIMYPKRKEEGGVSVEGR